MPFSLEEIPHLAHHNFSNSLVNDTYQLNQRLQTLRILISMIESYLRLIYFSYMDLILIVVMFLMLSYMIFIMDDIVLNDHIMSNIDVLFQPSSRPNHVEFFDTACQFHDEIIQAPPLDNQIMSEGDSISQIASHPF